VVPVDGGEIWVEDSQGEGTPLTFVHPGWGNSDIWPPVLAALDGYRTIRYDDRAHGRSPAPTGPFTLLGDLCAVLDHLGIERTALVGHSGGGGTSLGLALAEPGRVTSLVLVAPGVQDYPWPQDDPYGIEFRRLYEARDHDGLVDLGLRTWGPAGADPLTLAQINDAVSAYSVKLPHERPDPPAYGRLADVRAPAVMIRGDREYPMVAECSDAIASRIPGCARVIIPGADHMLPLRAPARLAELIAERIR